MNILKNEILYSNLQSKTAEKLQIGLVRPFLCYF